MLPATTSTQGLEGHAPRSMRPIPWALIDESTYIHDLAKTLKAEGRDEEVRVALIELASAKSLIDEHLKDAARTILTEQTRKYGR